MREIVYPEYHLTIPNLVKNILEIDQKEIERLSISAFANMNLISQKKDKNVIDALKFFTNKLNT